MCWVVGRSHHMTDGRYSYDISLHPTSDNLTLTSLAYFCLSVGHQSGPSNIDILQVRKKFLIMKCFIPKEAEQSQTCPAAIPSEFIM